jgi:hypothetical protein
MPSTISKSGNISDALAAARISYSKRNLRSQEIHKESSSALLGFQECSANRIALVDDDDVQCMMKTLHK